MFNYIKDAVINDVKALELRAHSVDAPTPLNTVIGLVVEQKDDKGVSTGAELVVKRVGNYKLEGIKNLFVTKGIEGKAGEYTLDLAPAFAKVDETGIIHVELAVKMDGKYLGEYANANWAKFGKKFIVELKGAAAGADADEVDAAIDAAFKEAVKDTDAPFDCEQNILSVKSDSKKLTITLSDPYLSISEDGAFVGVLASQCPGDCGLLDFEEIDVKVEAADADKPVLPFATGEWLMENLRVPTYYNRRFGAVGEKNYPIAGQVYDQIAFEYVMDRPGLGGLSAVGQKIQSATTHVLYVPTGSVVIGDGTATSLAEVGSVAFTAATATDPAKITFSA